MRYLIQFADKTSKTVTEHEGKAALQAWAVGKPVIIRGAGFVHHLISAIKPISKDWYEREYVENYRRLEEREQKRLTAAEEKRISDAKVLGFADKKLLDEAPSWSKA